MLFAVLGTRNTPLGEKQFGVFLTRNVVKAQTVSREESKVGPTRLVSPRNEAACLELAKLFAHNADRIEDCLSHEFHSMATQLRNYRDILIEESISRIA